MVFRRGNESLPKGAKILTETNLSVDSAGESYLLQIAKKYLQDYEKTFKDYKHLDKKRGYLHKTIKRVQEIIKKVKGKKSS